MTRPITLSHLEAKAILDGRKAQLRRAVKLRYPLSVFGDGTDGEPEGWPMTMDEAGMFQRDPCPYGQVGDQLWGREQFLPCRMCEPGCSIPDATYVCFRDGGQAYKGGPPYKAWSVQPPEWHRYKFRQANHMPQWASRLTLQVTGLRVERIQSISDADAVAEGVVPDRVTTWYDGKAASIFANTWQDPKYPWDSNPWVWVVIFTRVTS